MVSESIFIPKKVLIKVMIAQAANTITNPIKAAVIWPLADSVAPLSPPEVMYLIPPQINMKRNTKAAIIKMMIIKAETNLSNVIAPRATNSPPGVKSICARTVDNMMMSLCSL